MGAYKWDGVDDQVVSDGALGVTALPCSIGVVFMADTQPAAQVLAGLIDKDVANQYVEVQYVTTNDVAIRTAAGGTGASAISTGAGALDIWQTAIGVLRTTTSRDAYRDGANKGSNTTSRNWPTGLDRVMVGRFAPLSAPAEPFHGWIGYVFIWNVALSDAECAQFEAGTLPQQAAIVHMYDFTTNQGGIIDDLIGARDLTVTGAVYDGAVTPSPSFNLGGAPPDDKFFPFI